MTATLDHVRHCETCGKPIPLGNHETRAHYAGRRFCNMACRRTPRTARPQLPGIAWQDRAACTDLDRELFFADSQSLPDRRRAKAARAVCYRCPVRRDCLAYAIATDAYGVWGATTRDERLAMKAKKVAT